MTLLHLNQCEIYFDQISDASNPDYNIGTYVKIKGGLNISLFKAAIQSAKDVFDVFGFKHFSENTPEVTLYEDIPELLIEEFDFTGNEWSEQVVIDWLQERINKPFNIHSDQLHDFALIKKSTDENWFYMGCHHLFSDGYGVPYVFLTYIFDKYHALRLGIEKVFKYPSYLDLIEKSNAYLKTKHYAADHDYWQERFKAFQAPIIQEIKSSSFKTNAIQLFFTREEQNKLRLFCSDNGIGLQDFLIGMLAVYYQKTENATFFDYCIPTHNRTSRKERNTLGLFTKLIPSRIKLQNISLSELFNQIKANQRQDYRHKQFPISHFNTMMQESGNGSDPFGILINYRYFRLNTAETNLSLKGFKNDATYSKTPIEFSWCDFAENGAADLYLEITYREAYFNKEFIDLIANRLLCIVDEIYKDLSVEIKTIDILPKQEKDQLLKSFNNTSAIYPENETIIDLFEAEVIKSPDKIAVEFESQSLTYDELNRRSNQLAHYLKSEYQVGSDDLIGIKLERNDWMIISVLAVLKSGGAYVPIDLKYPKERIDFIESDIDCKLCLDEEELNKFKLIRDDYDSEETISDSKNSDSSLAYILYTSGSTGTPKGVMVEHQNAYSFIKWTHDEFKNSNFDTVLFTTSLNFDLAVFEIFHALTVGKKLVVLPDGLAIPAHVGTESKLLVNTVPSVVGSLLEEGMNFKSIHVLNMAGEPIPTSLKKALVGQVEEIRNLYGPSEDTTYSTFMRVDKDQRNLIGKPIANCQVYVLNDELALQPIGLNGEICLGGAGVTRGYLNQNKLTEEKFIVNPFRKGDRLYRSGDIGRWLPDGNLELVGRKDDQVKIRGYRIELGEVESVLVQKKEIEQAVVVATMSQDEGKYLTAYIKSSEVQQVDDLRTYLSERLPEYMLPSYFVSLDKIPLTPNGKIDKSALPYPQEGLSFQTKYQAPKNELEMKLVNLWERILKRDKIGVNDNFFSLGGHSIKAVQLNNAYQQVLSINLSLQQLFENKTISSHAICIEKATKNEFSPIRNVPKQTSYALSDAQRRLWILSQFEESAKAYNMPGSVKLNGNYQLNLFQQAFEYLIGRHEILRTVFKENETGQVRQWILDIKDLGFQLEYQDYRNEPGKAEVFIHNDSHSTFDFEKGPLFRATLLQLEEQTYELYLNMHHIISDGWSIDVLAKDLLHAYRAFKENNEPNLAPLKIQYKDYSAWQLSQLDSEIYKEDKSYWLNQLAGELPLLDLPTTKQRPKIKTSNGHKLSTIIDQKTVKKLSDYSQTNGGSIFMTLLALWKVLLYRYTAQKDIVIGTPTAGREHADLQDQIGFYVNTLALRNQINPADDFNTFYEQLKQNTLNSYKHQKYPFDRLIEELNIQRDTSRSPVFDIILTYQNEAEKIEGLAINSAEINNKTIGAVIDQGACTAKFDLDIEIEEIQRHLALRIMFNVDVYEKQMVSDLICHFQELLNAVLENPKAKISDLNYLSSTERESLLGLQEQVGFPEDKTVIDLFTEQVEQTPNNIALVFNQVELSYSRLDELSNQFAHYLQEDYKIKPNDLIGIKQDRSEWMIISILAVLKSGGAYVPIDPENPQERIEFIEKDTKCKVCIDEHELNSFQNKQENYSTNKLVSKVQVNDLAYIIYTSGSTGKPKGVMVDHHNVVRLFKNDKTLFNFKSTDVWTLFHSYAFDFSVWEMYGALLFGGKVVLVSKQVAQDPNAYLTLLKNQGVTILNQTPSSFYNLSKAAQETKAALAIRYVIFGGEALSPGRLSYWHEQYPNCQLINMYGITEGTVHTTYKEITQAEITLNKSNIGTAIPTVNCLVLDENRKLVPYGVSGELYIGGEGIAQGYLNREALTKERFVPNPFSVKGNLYRTGDKVKQLITGDLEYLGRIDDQVKIRGHRIELGEIENALSKNKAIEETVVLAKENDSGEKELIAYLTSKTTQNASDLRIYLRESLPDYMLPAYYVQLDRFPLTTNGKVNKKALPNPEGLSLTSGVQYVAPRNQLETQLVSIWEHVLLAENIGIKDDFFALGGNSLKAVRLSNEYQKKLAVKVTLRDLFSKTNIESQAKLITSFQKEEFIHIPLLASQVDEGYLLSNAQKRLWILSQFEDGSAAYNIPTQIELDGNYDLLLFQKAFDRVIERHEILRTVFKEDSSVDNKDGGIRQWVLSRKALNFKVDFIDLSNKGDANKSPKEAAQEVINENAYSIFDLENGPLIRATLFQLDDGMYTLYFNMHHIIGDGWSMERLSKEVFAYYAIYKDNKEPKLEPLQLQYKDYAAWQRTQLTGSEYEVHKSYWVDQLSGELPLMNLQVTKQRPIIKSHNGFSLSTVLDPKTTQRLQKYSSETEGSLFISLLATWNVLLYRYTGQQDLIFGTPVAGRSHPDLEEQIGCYVNTLALRNKIDPEESFANLYRRVKQNTLSAYDHQMYPFDQLIEDLKVERDTSRNPIFEVMLTLQNKFELDENGNVNESHKIIELGEVRSKFDLEIIFHQVEDTLNLQVDFNPDVYDKALVIQLIKHYNQLLEAILENPEVKVAQIDYLTSNEELELLVEFNNSIGPYPKNLTIVDVFIEQAKTTPNNTALVFEQNEISYAQLNEQSNEFANYLRQNYAIESNDLVGVRLEQGDWMIVAILGILKLGGAFVPIDPTYPQERIDFIGEDTEHKVCVDKTVFNQFIESRTNFSNTLKSVGALSNKLAYVIYTSGSTGKPKGVMVSHQNLMNKLYEEKTVLASQNNIITYCLTNYVFDVSLLEIFLPLISGGKLVTSRLNTLADTGLIIDKIIDHKVNVLQGTPTYFSHFLGALTEERAINLNEVLTTLCIGGESLNNVLVTKIKELLPAVKLNNHYGPTEITIDAIVNENITDFEVNIIGKPLGNTKVYILDEFQKIVPKNVVGEVVVSGDSVAIGYLNQDEISKEKFLNSPFIDGQRMYKTGDLGCWLSDGNIQFIGRKDNQVKIRGYRIELEEIERALLQSSSIITSAVIVDQNKKNENELVCFIVSSEEQNTRNLRAHLKGILPEYMLPARFVQLDELPLNANGKIDKKKLAKSNKFGIETGVTYTAPQNNIESTIVQIWQDILDKVTIGIDEGFFESGGNSLKLIRLKAKIKASFGVDFPVTSLFQHSTVRLQAKWLSKKGTNAKAKGPKPIQSGLSLNDENNDIAIIGMSIKAPGAENSLQFWDMLRAGEENVLHFTADELISSGIAESEVNQVGYVKANGYLENKACFDAGFFNFLSEEAKLMDPQTRVFHEVVWSALEDSGYNPIEYPGLIGLYAGAGSNVEWETYSYLFNEGLIDGFSASHLSDKDFSNTLIAHKLNLKGPVNSINTACSTSLVAIHHAAVSILNGENHMAIAGGVSIKSKKRESGYLYQEGLINSKDGHNRTFDSEASGTISSEGSGAVVLKKLSAAQADGDQIYAVLKGSAINNDGNRKVGYAAPSVDGQTEVIQMAQNTANVSPESISYLEAHGTATKLGDPIEVLALTQAFGNSKAPYCALGSVKTNIGHLDTAAGVAGFIKAVLCLKHKQLVPSLHFNSPNPEINFEESPFYVNTELKTWDKTDFPRRAGISSFGIGGTNAHVILEEAPEIEKTPISKELELIPLSAKTPEALIRQVDNLKAFLIENPTLSLADVAWSLQNRSAFSYRSAIVANSVEQAITKLETWASQSQLPTVKGKRIAFMFSGQGAQYENMGRGLYDDPSSIFRKSMDTCFELAAKESTTDFKSILYPTEPNQAKPVNETINTQPILFMFEYALAKQLAFYGIHPDIMIGHSIGEYVAACLSGVLSLETALQLVIKRGALMQNLPKGDMLAIGASSDSIKTYLTDKVDIAAVNTPDSCTVSGEPAAISALLAKLEQENILAKILHTSHAFHSGMMDPMLDEFTSVVSKVEMSTPSIPYISNVTGKEIKAEELTQEYWSNHIRGAVKFSAGINEIQSNGNTIFIEVGPGHSLSTLARQHIHTKGTSTAHQLIRHVKTNEADDVFFMEKLAQLWQAGIDMDWSQLNLNKAKHKISLPTYPFERIKYPMANGVQELLSKAKTVRNYQKKENITDWFYEESWKRVRLLPIGNEFNSPINYLLFCNKSSIVKGLIDRLKENKGTKIIKVIQSTNYKKIDQFTYHLNPEEQLHYLALFKDLETGSLLPNKVIHLWSYSNQAINNITNDLVKKELDQGYHSLLNITKAIGDVCPFQEIGIDVITSMVSAVNSEDIIYPIRTTVLGPVLTIPKEYTNISCKHIDLQSVVNSENTVNSLLDEIGAGYDSSNIAYRHGHRWIKLYDPIKLEARARLSTKFKEKGVYLITGGLGGMGLVFSKYLAETYKAKIILTGRKSKSEMIDSTLKKLGEDTVYLEVDVADQSQMELKLAEAESVLGKINGIIHTAGIGDYAGMIQNRTKEQCQNIFAAKIGGTIILNELAQKRDLDFMVLCSSGASIVAPFGQVAYTAANIFQNNFAQTCNGNNTYSIAWDTWAETGMAVEALSHKPELEREAHLNHGILNAEGTAVLERILDYPIANPLVFTTNLETILEVTNLEMELAEPQITRSRPLLSNNYEAPTTSIEKSLCGLVESFLGINEIGIKDDFFDLGIDSLKAMTLIGQIHQKLDVKLIINDVLENPNIHDLGKKIDALKSFGQMRQDATDMNFEHEIEI